MPQIRYDAAARTRGSSLGHCENLSRPLGIEDLNQTSRSVMATFVLVHGAWHGSWCWKRVRKALQTGDHEVSTPTLTGIAERSHLLSPHVNLDTHIEDVVNLIRWEELSEVVLCGHSYGGCVISGVLDRIPDRIGALVYLDAFVLENGQPLHDTRTQRSSWRPSSMIRRSRHSSSGQEQRFGNADNPLWS
jgi:pimeloyl-ACP methyl ester carboxylesterase